MAAHGFQCPLPASKLFLTGSREGSMAPTDSQQDRQTSFGSDTPSTEGTSTTKSLSTGTSSGDPNRARLFQAAYRARQKARMLRRRRERVS